MEPIREIDEEAAADIIDNRKPLGLFIISLDKYFIGIDNSTGDAWVEEFDERDECESWLRREFEIGDGVL